MDMKLDPVFIRAQRERRAWSQEHLAEVAGLGLRTIQRIEKTGAASYESARSLAAVFDSDVADLRVEQPAAAPRSNVNVAVRPVLGVLGALVAGGALLVTTTSFAADKVLLDVSVALDSAEPHALAERVVADEGTAVPGMNELRLDDLRFSIVPRVEAPDRIVLEVGIFERRGGEEVELGEPRLVAISGEAAEVVVNAGDERTLRLAITAQLHPRQLPPPLPAG